MTKNIIIEFCSDKFDKNFIKTFYNFSKKIQFILVRLLDLNPEPPVRSQALYPVELQAHNNLL